MAWIHAILSGEKQGMEKRGEGMVWQVLLAPPPQAGLHPNPLEGSWQHTWDVAVLLLYEARGTTWLEGVQRQAVVLDGTADLQRYSAVQPALGWGCYPAMKVQQRDEQSQAGRP